MLIQPCALFRSHYVRTRAFLPVRMRPVRAYSRAYPAGVLAQKTEAPHIMLPVCHPKPPVQYSISKITFFYSARKIPARSSTFLQKQKAAH